MNKKEIKRCGKMSVQDWKNHIDAVRVACISVEYQKRAASGLTGVGLKNEIKKMNLMAEVLDCVEMIDSTVGWSTESIINLSNAVKQFSAVVFPTSF